jgi:hypothetical protein
MDQPTPQLWAVCAHPQNYRIFDAVHWCEFDSWNSPRGDVRAGDRAVIWNAKGHDDHRGIVALAGLLTDPAPGVDPNRAYWVDPMRPDESNPGS